MRSANVDPSALRLLHAGVAEGAARWRIKGVPEGRYFLEATSQPSESLPGEPPFRVLTEQQLDWYGHTIWYGSWYYAREAEKAAEGSWVRLNATNVWPWEDSDSIEIMSRSADIWRTATVDFDPESQVQRSPPKAGATTLAGWELDLHRMTDSYGYDLHLATASDDLVVVHTRMSSADLSADPNDPWQGALVQWPIASFDARGTAFTSGGMTTLTGSFALLRDRWFRLDLQGSAFVDAVQAAVPDRSVNFRIVAVAEPGDNNAIYIGFAPTLFDIFHADARTVPVNEACYPADRDPCDPVACPAGCTNETRIVQPGDVAGTIHYGNPYDPEAAELLAVTASYAYAGTDPITGAVEMRACRALSSRRLRDLNGAAPITAELGLPTSITVGGVSLPADASTAGVGETPVIAWAAPTLGHPTSYFVDIFDSDDVTTSSGGVSTRRHTARIGLRGTSVRLPPGVLREGRHYTARITARRDGGTPFGSPTRRTKDDSNETQNLSGVFTR